MSRRCLICSNINPCAKHSEADQDAELRRNTAAADRLRAPTLNTPTPDAGSNTTSASTAAESNGRPPNTPLEGVREGLLKRAADLRATLAATNASEPGDWLAAMPADVAQDMEADAVLFERAAALLPSPDAGVVKALRKATQRACWALDAVTGAVPYRGDIEEAKAAQEECRAALSALSTVQAWEGVGASQECHQPSAATPNGDPQSSPCSQESR